jgi:hypothetical protein
LVVASRQPVANVTTICLFAFRKRLSLINDRIAKVRHRLSNIVRAAPRIALSRRQGTLQSVGRALTNYRHRSTRRDQPLIPWQTRLEGNVVLRRVTVCGSDRTTRQVPGASSASTTPSKLSSNVAQLGERAPHGFGGVYRVARFSVPDRSVAEIAPWLSGNLRCGVCATQASSARRAVRSSRICIPHSAARRETP